MTSVGIDFGTTNSVMAILGADGRTEVLPIDTPADAEWEDLGFDLVLPTVFGVKENNEIVFGWEAKLDAYLDAHGRQVSAVKRMFKEEESIAIGDQHFLVEEIATMFFAHMKKKAIGNGIDAKKVVVTVPANSRGLARYRTKIASGMGGLPVLALINEPTAAAMSYAYTSPYEQRIMVVDWGGGTLDVTVLQADSGVFIEQASSGIARSGGLDFDNLLMTNLNKVIPNMREWTSQEKAIFKLEVEKAKIRLSSKDFVAIPLPNGGMHRLDRGEFEQWIMPRIHEVRAPIERTLNDMRISPSGIDAVVLVGGTCKIPAVRQYIAEIMGQEAVSNIDPMTAIAEGAAIAAAIMSGDAPDKGFFVSTEHALGTYVSQGHQEPKVFSTIIPRNHKLPAVGAQQYMPVHEMSQEVNVEIVEGEEGKPEGDPANTIYASFPAPIPHDVPFPERGIEIQYEYDVDGLIKVTVTRAIDGLVLTEATTGSSGVTDKTTLTNISRKAKEAVESGYADSTAQPLVSPKLSKEHQELVNKARTSVLPFITEQEANEVKRLVENLENASPGEESTAAKALEDGLDPYSYLF
jgi:molecular chaperone DnaK